MPTVRRLGLRSARKMRSEYIMSRLLQRVGCPRAPAPHEVVADLHRINPHLQQAAARPGEAEVHTH